MKIKKDSVIKVWGVTFNGVEEIMEYAMPLKPKEGVYVADDSEFYPSSDRYEAFYEERSYWNFVFAKSKDELLSKLRNLHAAKPGADYYKFSSELHPMIYYDGDEDSLLEITEGEGVEIIK